MDLTLKLENNNLLNVRVAIILETDNGYVFSKHKKGFYFCIGGRCKINESSVQSAKREFLEETGIDLPESDFKLISLVENFYPDSSSVKTEEEGGLWNIHEINYVFTVPKQEKLLGGIDGEGLVEIEKSEVSNIKILPEIMKELTLSQNPQTFSHHIIFQN